MIGFEARCPMRYPTRCSLSAAEKAQVSKANEKYSVFLMMPFKADLAAVREAIEACFRRPVYLRLIADEVPAVAVKTCKICRLALAADFGVVLLSPANQNVIFEAGMTIGLQKPVIYLNNPTVEPPGQLPFDVSDQVYVEFRDPDSLRTNLEGHLPSFLERVVLHRRYDSEFREKVVEKLRKLSDDEFSAVEYILLEQRPVRIFPTHSGDSFDNIVLGLEETGIVDVNEGRSKHAYLASINLTYRPILEDEFFRIAEERSAAREPSE